MITFVKKTQPQPAAVENEQNRFEQIRNASKEKHLESEVIRRARQREGDNKLI